jgi:hypothetical protein
MESFIPVTVTIWGVSQLAVVKMTELDETVPSVVSELLSPIVTLAVGWEFNLTVKVTASPFSVVADPLGVETVMANAPDCPSRTART